MSDFKNEMLFQDFGINYAKVEPIYWKGSLLIRYDHTSKEKFEKYLALKESGKQVDPPRTKYKYKVTHEDLIQDSFWQQNFPQVN